MIDVDRIVGGLFDAYELSPNDIDEKREAMARVVRLELAPLEDEISRLQKLVYVPGLWRCAKCDFTLIQANLNGLDGSVTARDQPGDKCPNCHSPLWRVTERQASNDMVDRCEAAVVEAAGLREDAARLDWLDQVNKNINDHNGSKYGWRYDINHNRAALTDHNYPPLTIREAIDAARNS